MGKPSPSTGMKKVVVLSFVLIFTVSILIFLTIFKTSSAPAAVIAGGGNATEFVSNEISQGAPIIIRLPEEADESVKEQIVFMPAISGKWEDAADRNVLVFQPSKKLELGTTYTLSIPVNDGALTQYFEIVEPPKVVSILPTGETNENSEITIIFNRPMVPLTTLDALDASEIDVEITPATEGSFKWISTRSLQFQPAEKLKMSSHYKVVTGENFRSLDGVAVPKIEHEFTTRPLRHEGTISVTDVFGFLAYNAPLLSTFNQPIDVAKTMGNVSVKNTTTGKKVEVVGEYGTEEFFNETTGKMDTRINESTLAVYLAKDSHDRAKLWDFNGTYEYEISKVYPKEGDITYDEEITGNFTVGDVLQSKWTVSERSESTWFDSFDPKGTLVLQFYEEVNIGQSSITGGLVDKIEYVEECTDEEVLDEENCKKEFNKSKVQLSFKSNEIELSEKFNVTVSKVINKSGITINTKPINIELTAIPKFEIFKVVPAEGYENLTQLYICSSTPLLTPDFNSKDAEYKLEDFITTNLPLKFNSWDSYRVSEGMTPHTKCSANQFETPLNYNLNPSADYKIDLHLTDAFRQKAETNLSFKTGEVDPHTLNFYHMQEKYSVATPSATKLTFAATNMDYVDMDICQVQKRDMLELLNNGVGYTEKVDPGLCKWSTNKRLELPKKYWEQNFFQVTLADAVPSPVGHYVISFSHPSYKDWSNNKVYEHVYVTMTNLSVVEKELQIHEDRNTEEKEKLTDGQKSELFDLYLVTDAKTLESVEGAEITSYVKNPQDKEMSAAGSAVARMDGTAKMQVLPNKYGTIVSNKIDSAIIGDFETQLSWGSYAYNDEKVFIYTDRPIYRPGDTVKIKGIYRIGYDDDMRTLSGETVNLEIENSEYETVFEQTLTMNEFGTFNTEFTLDAGASLGSYTLRAGGNSARFDVEEYVPAAFKLELTKDKEEYMNGDTLNLDVQADYYFGVPLEEGTVEYSILAQDYFFDRYTDEYFRFGSGFYSCYDYCYTNDKFVLLGNAKLDSKGHSKISQELDFDKLFADDKETDDNIGRSRIFILNLSVMDSAGRQISSQESFIAHGGEVYLGVNTDKYFLQSDEKFNLKVKSVDTQGNEVKQSGIKGSISKVTWEYNKRKEVDGGFYYNAEKKLTVVKEFGLSTDGDGNWSDSFSLKDQGEYEIGLTAKDSKGNTIKTIRTMYVHGGVSTSGLVRPTNDTSLELINDTGELTIGDTASFMIKNPYSGKVKALIALERGEIFDYQVVEFDQSFYNFEFKIKDEYVPNVYASVVLISGDPGMKYGSTTFKVSSKEKALDINVSSDKKNYLPGEKVNLNFFVADVSGQPVVSELSVAIVDMSVLALKGNPHKNPLLFFYRNLPLTIATSANLKNLLHEIDIKSGKGGGGGEELDKKKRGLFKDTAYWRAELTTAIDGKATAVFTLPDNLTTWQIETLGITKDTLVGVDYMEIMTQKQVSLTPLKPRFIVPGDSFEIGAKVFNQSEETQKLDVGISSDTLLIAGGKSQSVKLGKGETETVYFEVTAPSNLQYGSHKFTLSAKNESFEDSVEQDISITRNHTYESVATAGNTNQDIAQEFIFLPKNIVPDEGVLQINTSATLAVFLSDALNSMLSYAYGCTEQIASKLRSIAVVKSGLDIENIGDKFKIEEIIFDGKPYTMDEIVPLGLARIAENQNDDGGFAYYKGMTSNLYLTESTLEALATLDEAGYSVNKDMLDKAAVYIIKEVTNANAFSSPENLIFAAHAVASSNVTRSQLGILKPLLHEKVLSNKKVLNEELGNMPLAYLALTMSENSSEFSQVSKNNVFDILENRVKIDARGAHLEGGNSWYYYDSSVKSTALYLRALTADKRESELTGNLLRWLLHSRSKDGAWGSTSNTTAVVEAFTDYMKWQGENKSDFTLAVKINGEELESFDFNPDTILDQKSLAISPLNKLSFGKLLPLQFIKTNRNDQSNNFYYDIGMTYFLPIEEISARDEGFTITRNFYALDENRFEESDIEEKTPKVSLSSATVGDVLHGQLEIIVPETRHFVAIEDYIPAGTELVNFNLSTENSSLVEGEEATDNSDNWWGYDDGKFRPDRTELRDDRVFLFKEEVGPGTYTYDYYVRVLIPGKFLHLPAVVSEMYFPENFGRTEGGMFEVK